MTLAAVLDPLQYFRWDGPSDNLPLINAISKALREPESATRNILPAPGGGLLPSSDIYIYRTEDEDFQNAIIGQESIVLLKGSRQVGKTSMLARGLETARGTTANVVITDFEILSASEMETLNSLFLALANWIQESLSLEFSLDWRTTRSPQRNFERFLQNVLNGTDKPLVWAMDEVDKVFAYPYASEFFGAIRNWHNSRALEPQKPWTRLTVILAYATEASLFLPNLNQSPFNVGTRLGLSDFSEQQVSELNKKFGQPLATPEALSSFYELIGGHPYLTNRGLQVLSADPQRIATFAESADLEDGPYGDHLRRYLMLLGRDEPLWDALAAFLRKELLENKTFIRLRAGRLLKGNTPQQAEIRCRLYEKSLVSKLTPDA